MDRKCRGIDWAGCPAPSRTGWRQPGGLWFPRLLSVESQGVKPGHHWQLSVTSWPHLKDRAQETGEKGLMVLCSCREQQHRRHV
ncbi:unnamed protein product [Pleuronectes platessa]|uniref:Uncharacterized protein n=1 Tax=Pleuronectes platessa TaxID=8262 RepID=A0A9N7UZT7_PLEPL|nr:unnamed protein product [Pleuronectes platessa]